MWFRRKNSIITWSFFFFSKDSVTFAEFFQYLFLDFELLDLAVTAWPIFQILTFQNIILLVPQFKCFDNSRDLY